MLSRTTGTPPCAERLSRRATCRSPPRLATPQQPLAFRRTTTWWPLLTTHHHPPSCRWPASPRWAVTTPTTTSLSHRTWVPEHRAVLGVLAFPPWTDGCSLAMPGFSMKDFLCLGGLGCVRCQMRISLNLLHSVVKISAFQAGGIQVVEPGTGGLMSQEQFTYFLELWILNFLNISWIWLILWSMSKSPTFSLVVFCLWVACCNQMNEYYFKSDFFSINY